jgi:hypothetical protein
VAELRDASEAGVVVPGQRETHRRHRQRPRDRRARECASRRVVVEGEEQRQHRQVQRPFFVPYSSDDTWDLSLNNLIRLARGIELQVSYAYYGDRNIAQGTQQARSSFDLGLAMPVLDDNTELTVSIADLFNDFGLRQHIVGDGFEADYENYYETQVVSVGLKRKF